MKNTLLSKKLNRLLLSSFVFLILFVPFKSKGQSLLNQNFEFSGNLTSNGWTAHNGGGTSPIATTTPGLTYAGLSGTDIGSAALVKNTGGEDLNVTFATQNTNNQSVYFSLLVNVTEPGNKTGDYFFHTGGPVTAGWTSFAGRIYARVVSGNVNFGLSNSSTVTWGTTNYAKNTTYLLIMKYTINTGGADSVSLWVIPSGVPSTEILAGTPEVVNTTTNGSDTINGVGLRQGSNTTSTQVVVDAIKVGTTWESVTPSSTSAPTVTNTAATVITANSAILAGNVTATGGAAITATGSVYALTSADATPTIGEANVTTLATSSPSAGTGTFSNTTGTGLAVNAQYSYNAYATNSVGTSYGTAATFYTLAVTPNAPVVGSPTTNSLTVALDTSDDNPSGTQYAIQETGGLYVQADGSLGASPVWRTETAWGATVTVTGLSSVTTYTFQVKGRNGDGVETDFGAAASATTTANLSPTIEADTLTAFGALCITTSATNSFAFIGYNLTNEAVTVGPLSGYSFSTTLNGTYTSSLSITPDVNGEVAETVYVKFTPTAVASYNGFIVIAGGGTVAAVNVTVSGSGIDTPVSVVTGSSASVTSNSAVLNGSLTAGCSAVTASGIEYSINADFSASTTMALGGTASSLLPNTTYYFRAFATDATGTVTGTSASFTTLNLSAPVATAATAVGTSSFTANWEAVTGAADYALDVYTKENTTVTVNADATYNFADNFTSGSTVNTPSGTIASGLLTYTTATNGASTATRVFGSPSALRVYFNGSGNGGSITINVTGGITVTKIDFEENAGGDAANYAYYVDGSSTPTGTGSFTGNTATTTISGLAATSSIRVQNRNTTSSTVFISGIKVYYTSTSGGVINVPVSGSPFTISAPTTSNVVSGLLSNTNYYYTVEAVNGAAVSPSSNEVAVTTLVSPPTFGSVFQTSDVVCENGAATFNVIGLVPNSTSTISYTVNGGAVQTATNVVANASGFATFNVALSLADNGQLLTIIQIERTDFTTSVLTLTSDNTALISVSANVTYYADADGDGFGNAAISVVSCDGIPVVFGNPAVLNNTDCDDSDNTKNATFSFYADADGDGVGFGSLVSGVCAVNATTPPAGYSLTNTDCSPNDGTTYQEGTFYVDADGDNYAANGTATVICYGAVAPIGYSMVNLGIDCNDAIAAINPGASEILYDGVDNNCNDILDEGFQITTTMVNCGTTLSSLSSTVSCVPIGAANGYMFEVTNVATGQVQTIDRGIYHWFTFSSLPNYDYATTYSIRVMIRKASNNIWLGYYGPACLYSTPPVIAPAGGSGTVQLQTYCGQTLPTISTVISTTALNGVTGYRFRVTNTATGAVETVTRTVNWFSLTMLSTYNYGTTYAIDVAVKTTADFTDYGAPCNVTTPAVPSLTNYCGQTLPTIGTVISTTPLNSVTSYRFRVTNTSTGAVQTLTRSVHWFALNMLSSFNYGTTYTIEVALKTTGDYSDYGSSCTVSSPAVPTLTNYCGGATVPSRGAAISTSSLNSVTSYEFTVERYNSSFELISSSVVVKSLPRFTFNDITNYAPNTTYSVRVRVFTAGSWSPLGDACEIVSPAATREIETKADDNLFSVVGYPNPYDYQFSFRMESSSDAPVSIKVYDMIGKLIESREVNAVDMPVQTLGERYTSGVYNVVVTQEQHVKTFRMIKR